MECCLSLAAISLVDVRSVVDQEADCIQTVTECSEVECHGVWRVEVDTFEEEELEEADMAAAGCPLEGGDTIVVEEASSMESSGEVVVEVATGKG